jgi:hypothetical protein
MTAVGSSTSKHQYLINRTRQSPCFQEGSLKPKVLTKLHPSKLHPQFSLQGDLLLQISVRCCFNQNRAHFSHFPSHRPLASPPLPTISPPSRPACPPLLRLVTCAWTNYSLPHPIQIQSNLEPTPDAVPVSLPFPQPLHQGAGGRSRPVVVNPPHCKAHATPRPSTRFTLLLQSHARS